MDIYLLLAGTKRGPFSQETVRQYLADGLIVESDPACRGEGEDWVLVSDVLTPRMENGIEIPEPRRRKKRRTRNAQLKAARNRFWIVGLLAGSCLLAIFGFYFSTEVATVYTAVTTFLFQLAQRYL